MKLQNLSIIFIIIMLPIILVVSYYLSLQKSTLSMQMSYDQKLLESTKEAIEAFEVNTTEWNEVYSNLSDSKRRDVTASINTFITSLSNNLGISGVAKESLLSHIPAVAFTLYDGYYVYAPTYTPVVAIYTKEDVEKESDTIKKEEIEGKIGQAKYDSAGNLLYEKLTGSGTTTKVSEAKTEYKHTLTTHLPYSKKYGNMIVEYTLDNYVKVYGTDSLGNVIERSGYLLYTYSSVQDRLPDAVLFNISDGDHGVSTVQVNPESIEEKIILNQDSNGDGNLDTATYQYIYDVQNEKYYYETEEGENKDKFFRISDGEKIYLDEDVSIGEFGAKFRKVVVRLNNININVYQLLNAKTGTEWYIDKDNDGNLDERITDSEDTIEVEVNGINKNINEKDIWDKIEDVNRTEDYSAMNYYLDAFDFTNWVKTLGIPSLIISDTNDPDDPNSPFAVERREVIKESVQSTLNTSIMQYIKVSGEEGLKVIQISEEDWDQIVRNVSIISFFQGVPVGLKYYNNYAIATSTTNNEFINKDEIYFSIRGDTYYHSKNCEIAEDTGNIIGYKNTDYIIKSYKDKHFYLHDYNENTNSELACYHCLVGSNDTNIETREILYNPYITALARERYVQNKNIQYVNGELRDNLRIDIVRYKLNGGIQDWNFPLEIEKPRDSKIVIEGKTTKNNTNGFVYWYGKMDDGTTGKYRDRNQSYNDSATELLRYGNYTEGMQYEYKDNQSITLTAAYKVQLNYDMSRTNELRRSKIDEQNIPSSIAIDYGIDEGGGYETKVSDKLKLYESTITLDNHERYRFVGWSTNPNAKNEEDVNYDPGDTIYVSDNVTTLYDVWEKMICLTISPNPTSNEMTENEYVYFPQSTGGKIKIENDIIYNITGGSNTCIQEEISRNGFKFVGWSYTAERGAAILSGNDIAITENKTIYAVWGEIKPKKLDTITWRTNTGDNIGIKEINSNTHYAYTVQGEKNGYQSEVNGGGNRVSNWSDWRTRTKLHNSTWHVDGYAYIGSISLSNSGKKVIMQGNEWVPGKNAIWTKIQGDEGKSAEIESITFNYSIDFGDSMNAAGVIIGVQEDVDNNKITGYMLSFNNVKEWINGDGDLLHLSWAYKRNGVEGDYKNATIWTFTYTLNNYQNIQKTYVKDLIGVSNSGRLTIQMLENGFQIIKQDGTPLYTSPNITNFNKTTFGYFSDHYYHGCSDIGKFILGGDSESSEIVVNVLEW